MYKSVRHKMISILLPVTLLIVTSMIGVFTSNEAAAQVRPAITKNVDEPGRIPYQQFVQGTPGSGCGTNFCTFSLPAVPAGKRLVITDFYGTVSLQPGAKVDSLRLYIRDNSLTELNSYEVPPNPAAYYTVALTFQLDRYPFQAKVQMYAEAGQIPTIDFWTGPGSLNNNGWPSKFTVVGYLVDLNQ